MLMIYGCYLHAGQRTGPALSGLWQLGEDIGPQALMTLTWFLRLCSKEYPNCLELETPGKATKYLVVGLWNLHLKLVHFNEYI